MKEIVEIILIAIWGLAKGFFFMYGLCLFVDDIITGIKKRRMTRRFTTRTRKERQN